MRRVRGGSAFEAAASYCRAIAVGPFVIVSGTAAIGDDGEIVSPGDAYGQTRTVLERALSAAEELGARLDQVVQTRLYYTADADWREGVRAHGEIFAGIDPANTTVLVAALPPAGALVEAELTAWTGAP